MQKFKKNVISKFFHGIEDKISSKFKMNSKSKKNPPRLMMKSPDF